MARPRKRKPKPPVRRRDRAREGRTREAHVAERRAEVMKLTPAQYGRRRILGWALVAAGSVVFVQHLVSHMGFFTLISSGVDDLVAGYPLAGLLGLLGVVVLTRA